MTTTPETTALAEARLKATAWAEHLRTHGVSTSATVGEIKRQAFMDGFDARALLAVPQPGELEADERQSLADVIAGDQFFMPYGVRLRVADAILAAGFTRATHPVPAQDDAGQVQPGGLPSENGWYADSGGYMWALEDGVWDFYGNPDIYQPESPTGFAPFTRMLPVAIVEGMLGQGLPASPPVQEDAKPLDPEPWQYQDGERWTHPSSMDDEVPEFSPRDEFEQDRARYPASPSVRVEIEKVVVTTVEELDALPVGTVVLTKDSSAAQKLDDRHWQVSDLQRINSPWMELYFSPSTVLFVPPTTEGGK